MAQETTLWWWSILVWERCQGTRIRDVWSESILRAASCPHRGWVFLLFVLTGNGILRASPTSESSSEAERDGRERRGLLPQCSWQPRMAWHPHPSFSLTFGWTPAICSGTHWDCRVAAILQLQTLQGREGSCLLFWSCGWDIYFFSIYTFYLILWWLLLPLAQDF